MVGVFPFIFKQLDIKGNGTERIPDFMSDLRSESPDRGQALRLNEPLLHGPLGNSDPARECIRGAWFHIAAT